MRGPQLLPPVKSLALDAVRLLSWCFFQPESNASLQLPNPPSVSVTNSDSPYEQYSKAVHQLHSLFPPDCPSLEADDAKVVSGILLGVWGYADIFEVTLYGRSVIQKSYRRYETGDFEPIFRVRDNRSSSCDVLFMFFFLQEYCRDVLACSRLSHPNVAPFVGITSPPPHPFSLIFDTAGHLGLKEYLRKHPQANRLDLVCRLPFSIRLHLVDV